MQMQHLTTKCSRTCSQTCPPAGGKVVEPVERNNIAAYLMDSFSVSITRACRVVSQDINYKIYDWNSFEIRGDILIHYWLQDGIKVQDHGKILKKRVITDEFMGKKVYSLDFIIQTVKSNTEDFIFTFDQITVELIFVVRNNEYNPSTGDFEGRSLFRQEK
jgi:hypothetical protein